MRRTFEAAAEKKVLALPIGKGCILSRHAQFSEDLPDRLIAQSARFFQHYKDLAPNRWARIEGWADADAARAEIVAGVECFKVAQVKPFFRGLGRLLPGVWLLGVSALSFAPADHELEPGPDLAHRAHLDVDETPGQGQRVDGVFGNVGFHLRRPLGSQGPDKPVWSGHAVLDGYVEGG